MGNIMTDEYDRATIASVLASRGLTPAQARVGNFPRVNSPIHRDGSTIETGNYSGRIIGDKALEQHGAEYGIGVRVP
jgi:hypothetical protein